MALFVARCETPLSPTVAWERLTDWPRHARHVPFTSVVVPTAPPNGVGTLFVARTTIGPMAFDDPMEVIEWVEPDDTRSGRARLAKRGPVMTGWAELAVGFSPRGSWATWTEDIAVARLPRLFDPLTALSSRLLFTRVLRKLVSEP
jgi:hypothetical protein